MDPITIALTILLLPLAAFAIQVLAGWRLPRQGDWLPTAAMAAAFGLSAYLFVDRVLLAGPQGMEPVSWARPWLALPSALGLSFSVDFGVLLDNLSVTMLLVVTLVSLLVHVYSMGYMRDHHGDPEPGYHRFFAYLALFTFSMLLLVLASDLLILFIAWELVGVCSYLLIGFYFQKRSAANASMKAFITNRVGDLGFFLGILIIFSVVGSLDMLAVFDSVESGQGAWGSWSAGLLTAAALGLLCGVIGKSAQFPLHVWLPDAMEGPTPVSALIHAATMVAAGVYMLARLFPIFAGPGIFAGDVFASEALYVVAAIGSITALGAATIALVQTDIKKVLAYSTVSQLGYMVLAIGVGSVSAGIFHLFTHAFFKACLFLGAGSVIHAVHSNEMRDMGGLRRRMPWTYATFLISTCAIAGVPFLSGFWSKEAVLESALAFGLYKGSVWALLPFLAALLTALLTAFYMFRVVWLTFHGAPRDVARYEGAHESPPVMTGPLVILAALAIVAGGVVGEATGWLERRVAPDAVVGRAMAQQRGVEWQGALPPPPAGEAAFGLPAPAAMLEGRGERWAEASRAAHTPVLLLSLLAAAGGILGSWLVFLGPYRRLEIARRGALARFRRVLEELYYIDWLYMHVLLGAVALARGAVDWFDKRVIDGLVNLTSRVGVVVAKLAGVLDYWGVDGAVRGGSESVLMAGSKAQGVQTGRLQDYIYLTLVLLAFIFVLWIVAGTLL